MDDRGCCRRDGFLNISKNIGCSPGDNFAQGLGDGEVQGIHVVGVDVVQEVGNSLGVEVHSFWHVMLLSSNYKKIINHAKHSVKHITIRASFSRGSKKHLPPHPSHSRQMFSDLCGITLYGGGGGETTLTRPLSGRSGVFAGN